MIQKLTSRNNTSFTNYLNAISCRSSKVVCAVLTGLILMGGITIPVEASATGQGLEVEIRSTGRGLGGNAQGTARARRTQSGSMAALRVRVRVERRDNHNNWVNSRTQTWYRTDNPTRNAWRSTTHFTGNHRANTRVRGQAQRLATANGNWSATISHNHTY